MFSNLKITFPNSKEEVLAKISEHSTIQELPFAMLYGNPTVKWTNVNDANNLKIRITGMFIFFPYFGTAKLVSEKESECRIVGRIFAGPILLALLLFAYSFMIFELVRTGIRDFGTDKFAFTISVTLFALVVFILIPAFVVRGWKKNLRKEIIKRIGSGT